VLVIGATSAIAHEADICFAAGSAELFLVGRNPEKLAAVAQDLKVHGAARVVTALADLTHLHHHPGLINCAIQSLGGLDAALIAHGSLPDQVSCEKNWDEVLAEFRLNATSVISLVSLLANYFERQQHGCIAVISSVAGDRGRRSNYIYGSAKGAVSLFLEGVRGRLHEAGVSVVTIKPGFVDTPMTDSKPKNFLFASPRSVGRGVYWAMVRGKDVVYLPWFWRWIMLAVRTIPGPVFKRMGL
jgi:short-subunit dehydrogenase